MLQHYDEIRSLGIDYGKTKSNGIRGIFISYNLNRDSSGGKALYPENDVPADPKVGSNAFNSLNKENIPDKSSEDNTVHAIHDKLIRGNSLIAMAADMMKKILKNRE